MRFGQHAGRAYSEVLSDWPGFCKALLAVDLDVSGLDVFRAATTDPAALPDRALGFSEQRLETYVHTYLEEGKFCKWVQSLTDKTADAIVQFSQWLTRVAAEPPLQLGVLIGAGAAGMRLDQVVDALADLAALRAWILLAGGGRVAFGRHNTKTFEAVLAADPGYCDWVLGATRADASLPLLTLSCWVRLRRAQEVTPRRPEEDALER